MRQFVSRIDNSLLRWVAISSVWAALFLVFAFIFIYASVAVPFADDYGRATTASLGEAYKRVISDYFNWTGRWASMAIQYGTWGLVGADTKYLFSVYRTAIFIILLCNLIGWFLLVRLVTFLDGWKAAALAIGVGGTYLSVFHSPGQTLYWLPGATEGGLSSLLAAVVLWGSVPLFLQSSARISALKIFLLSIGIFVSTGCHELGGMFLATFFSLALISNFLLSNGWNVKILIYLLIASTVATVLAVFAPGNSVRAAAEGMQTGSLFHAMNAGSQICLRTLRTVVSPALLLGAAILIVHAKSQPDSFFKIPKSACFALLVVVPLALSAVAAVVALKTATTPAGRTVNFFVSILVYTWLPAVVIWVSRLCHLKDFNIPTTVPAWLWALFALSIVIGPTFDRAFFSYKTYLPAWIQYQNNKHLILSSAESSDIVTINEPPPAPPMFFTETDITTDPKVWINEVQSVFYGVRQIFLEKHNGKSTEDLN